MKFVEAPARLSPVLRWAGIAVVSALVSGAVSAADAAGAQCRWVDDPIGDAVDAGGETQLDLVSADISTVAQAIRVAIRVSDLGTGEVPPGGYARLYSVVLSLNDERVVLVARESEDGAKFSAHVEAAAAGAAGLDGPAPQSASVSVNRRSDMLAITAPLTSVRVFVRAAVGDVVTSGTVVASRDVTPRYPLTDAPVVSARPDNDTAATAGSSYRIGASTCRR